MGELAGAAGPHLYPCRRFFAAFKRAPPQVQISAKPLRRIGQTGRPKSMDRLHTPNLNALPAGVALRRSPMWPHLGRQKVARLDGPGPGGALGAWRGREGGSSCTGAGHKGGLRVPRRPTGPAALARRSRTRHVHALGGACRPVDVEWGPRVRAATPDEFRESVKRDLVGGRGA